MTSSASFPTPPNPSAVNPEVKRECSASQVIDQLKIAEQDPRRSPSPAPAHLTPLEHIAELQAKGDRLQKEVGSFTGVKSDTKYCYLEEMLTRLLIKLDHIDSNGQLDIREARRAGVRSIQSICDELELIGMASTLKNGGQASVKEMTLDSEHCC